MKSINSFIAQRLLNRIESKAYRSLSTESALVDFCSNDYLGFARSEELQSQIRIDLSHRIPNLSGSTGSRLISGNHTATESLEERIADFHQAEAGLLFNSGYDANLGLFSSIPQRGDTIITDELIHASIIDGARLSFANRYTFAHNDLQSLEDKLKIAKGRIFIGIESIYSMDGDEAPLEAIVSLAEKYDAALIVDEAHATGIFGNNGVGLVQAYHLQDRVFARLVTFGKALGCHGAIVLGSDRLRQYLINFARSFIYTTAAPAFNHISVEHAYRYLQAADYPQQIHNRIALFKTLIRKNNSRFIESNSPIQCVLSPGNEQAKTLESTLKSEGFNVRAILHPTVPEGKERLRICLHTFNTDTEIKLMTEVLTHNL